MVGEEILISLISASTFTMGVFDNRSQPFDKLYVARKGGDVAECSWNNWLFAYTTEKLICSSEDVDKTIDVYVGATPPPLPLLREKIKRTLLSWRVLSC